MALSENGTLEYKRQYTPDIKKEVVAFANIVGGTVYIGTDDDGTSVGGTYRTWMSWHSSLPTPCGTASSRT